MAEDDDSGLSVKLTHYPSFEDLPVVDNSGNVSMKAWIEGAAPRGGMIGNGDDRHGPATPLARHGAEAGSTGNGKRLGILGTPVCHGTLA